MKGKIKIMSLPIIGALWGFIGTFLSLGWEFISRDTTVLSEFGIIQQVLFLPTTISLYIIHTIMYLTGSNFYVLHETSIWYLFFTSLVILSTVIGFAIGIFITSALVSHKALKIWKRK